METIRFILDKLIQLILIVWVVTTSFLVFAICLRLMYPNEKGISILDIFHYFKFSIILICLYLILKLIKKLSVDN